MFNRSAAPSVINLSSCQSADYSTESSNKTRFLAPDRAHVRSKKTLAPSEHRLLPMTCQTGLGRDTAARPVDGSKERKEAADQGAAAPTFSKRKERFVSGFVPLLINPNTSGIGQFADQQRRQIVAADEVVMDRSAERAARGCDVI